MKRADIIRNSLAFLTGHSSAGETASKPAPKKVLTSATSEVREVTKLSKALRDEKSRPSIHRQQTRNFIALTKVMGVDEVRALLAANDWDTIEEKNAILAAELKSRGLKVFGESENPEPSPTAAAPAPAPAAIAAVVPAATAIIPASEKPAALDTSKLSLDRQIAARKSNIAANPEIAALEKQISETKPGLTRECREARLKALKS